MRRISYIHTYVQHKYANEHTLCTIILYLAFPYYNQNTVHSIVRPYRNLTL